MNNKEIKELVYKILEEEKKQYNLEVDVLALTPLQNIFDILFSGLKRTPKRYEELILLLDDIKEALFLNRTEDAYYNTGLNILKILIKKQEKNITDNQFLWSLLINIYHEFKHVIIKFLIKQSNITIKEDLYYALEDTINSQNPFYLIYHDDFYEEIISNIYAVKKAELFLKTNKKYHNIYQELITTIELEKLLRNIYYRNYNFRLMLAEINKHIKYDIKEINKHPYNKTLEVVRILYNKDGKFKSLKELSLDTRWNNFTKEARYLVVSSTAYLDDFDYNNAPKEDLYFILDAITYSLTLEYEKPKYNKEFRKKLEELSKRINMYDICERNLYLDTLSILNQKETANELEIKKLKTKLNIILSILKQKELSYKIKKNSCKKTQLSIQ